MAEAKSSYTIACSSAFRDAVLALAEKRSVNAADLARSILLTIPDALIALYPDPGGPRDDDRETVTLKGGQKAGRVLRRKPRLQLRLPAGLSQDTIRKALSLALAFDSETMSLQLQDPAGPTLGGVAAPPPPPPEPAPPAAPPPPDLTPQLEAAERQIAQLREDAQRLHSILDVVLFEPLESGVETYDEALFVFGFPPYSRPGSRELRTRYRILASVHHPDSSHGSHERMSQINSAMDILRQGPPDYG